MILVRCDWAHMCLTCVAGVMQPSRVRGRCYGPAVELDHGSACKAEGRGAVNEGCSVLVRHMEKSVAYAHEAFLAMIVCDKDD
jgi:hypothetical protein